MSMIAAQINQGAVYVAETAARTASISGPMLAETVSVTPPPPATPTAIVLAIGL